MTRSRVIWKKKRLVIYRSFCNLYASFNIIIMFSLLSLLFSLVPLNMIFFFLQQQDPTVVTF